MYPDLYDTADYGISPSGFLNVERMAISVNKKTYTVKRWTSSISDASQGQKSLTLTHYSGIEDYIQVSYNY